ncbi:unnamed protein product [Lampetra planeri]
MGVNAAAGSAGERAARKAPQGGLPVKTEGARAPLVSPSCPQRLAASWHGLPTKRPLAGLHGGFRALPPHRRGSGCRLAIVVEIAISNPGRGVGAVPSLSLEHRHPRPYERDVPAPSRSPLFSQTHAVSASVSCGNAQATFISPARGGCLAGFGACRVASRVPCWWHGGPRCRAGHVARARHVVRLHVGGPCHRLARATTGGRGLHSSRCLAYSSKPWPDVFEDAGVPALLSTARAASPLAVLPGGTKAGPGAASAAAPADRTSNFPGGRSGAAYRHSAAVAAACVAQSKGEFTDRAYC